MRSLWDCEYDKYELLCRAGDGFTKKYKVVRPERNTMTLSTLFVISDVSPVILDNF